MAQDQIGDLIKKLGSDKQDPIGDIIRQETAPTPQGRESGQVSPRDAARIEAQQRMDNAVKQAQEANCGRLGDSPTGDTCRESVGNAMRQRMENQSRGR